MSSFVTVYRYVLVTSVRKQPAPPLACALHFSHGVNAIPTCMNFKMQDW